MKIILDGLTKFRPWGEANTVLKKVLLANKFNELEQYLENLGGEFDGNELNDILAGYTGIDILKELGIENIQESLVAKLNRKFGEALKESEIDSYAVLVRDYHNGIPSLYYTNNEEEAHKVFEILSELENPPEELPEEEYESWSIPRWNEVNELVIDQEEVNRRDIDNGVYSNVLIVNDIPVDIF